MSMPLYLIVRKMNRLNVLHRIYIHKQVSQNGLYFGQPPILEYVWDHDQCTQCELADFMQVSPPSIATSVKRMQKAGLLQKTMDKDDLRYNRISITEKGKELASKCREDFDKIDGQLFDGFSEQEREQLCGYLDRMIQNMATGEFADKTFFSLIAEEKKLHDQRTKEERNID